MHGGFGWRGEKRYNIREINYESSPAVAVSKNWFGVKKKTQMKY